MTDEAEPVEEVDPVDEVDEVEVRERADSEQRKVEWWRRTLFVVVIAGSIAVVAFAAWALREAFASNDAQIEYRDDRITTLIDRNESLTEQNDELLEIVAEMYAACEQADDCDTSDLPTPAEVAEDQEADLENTSTEPQTLSLTDQEIDTAIAVHCSEGGCAAEPTLSDMLAALQVFCADGACQGEEGDEGDQGEPGPPPTAEQLATTLVAYCSDGRCDASQDEIAAAVAAQCANGACNGPQGAAGRPPTAEEILAAVQSFCANGACDGDDGADGADAPTITTVTCTEGVYVFGFSDGSTVTSNAACSTTPPDPEPTEPVDPPEETP